jgi:hypothetical protein
MIHFGLKNRCIEERRTGRHRSDARDRLASLRRPLSSQNVDF